MKSFKDFIAEAKKKKLGKSQAQAPAQMRNKGEDQAGFGTKGDATSGLVSD